MASKRIGIRGNPSSPLNPGVSDSEQILKEARKILSSTSSGKFKHPSTLEILESSQFLLPTFDPHSEKGKEELDSLFTPSQFEYFQVFTNPLLYEEVKAKALQIDNHFLFTSHIPFTEKVLPYQPKISNFPLSSKQPITNQSNSSSTTSISPRPKMAGEAMDYMDRIVAATYAPLVMPQPLHALLRGDY